MTFRTKPLVDLVWKDIVELATSGTAEDAMLEFKGLLPEKNGKDHPWYSGRDQITDFTRDELAAEVVALANAYGGRLVIGIAETKDRPRKAAGPAPLPRCEKFAEQFEQALRSVIDPPIGGLQIRAVVDPDADGSGAVVVAIPASDFAPHGIGRPPAAYVRRGTACEPMTMRDLQSVFWDARAKRERIDRIRQRESVRLKEALSEAPTSLASVAGGSHVFDEDALCLRITAISHQSLGIRPDDLSSIAPQIRLARSAFANGWWPPFGDGQPSHGWSPRAHGLQAIDEGPSVWTVLQDGTVTTLGIAPGSSSGGRGNLHFPGWYVLHAAQVMVMTEHLRRLAGRPDVPFELDIEMVHRGKARAWDERTLVHIDPRVEIEPVIVGARAGILASFREIETQIWHGMGLSQVQRATVAFERWLDPAEH